MVKGGDGPLGTGDTDICAAKVGIIGVTTAGGEASRVGTGQVKLVSHDLDELEGAERTIEVRNVDSDDEISGPRPGNERRIEMGDMVQ